MLCLMSRYIQAIVIFLTRQCKAVKNTFSFTKHLQYFFEKNYCNWKILVLNYLSLMCDEAGGCDRKVGNFRGVCPINGRQQI